MRKLHSPGGKRYKTILSKHTPNPVGLRFECSKKIGKSVRSDGFLTQENGGIILSVLFSEIRKTQGSDPVRFLKVRFLARGTHVIQLHLAPFDVTSSQAGVSSTTIRPPSSYHRRVLGIARLKYLNPHSGAYIIRLFLNPFQ